MFSNKEKEQARRAIDECAQDLFEARLRLEELRTVGDIPDPIGIAKERNRIDDYTKEFASLKQEWSARTSRKYKPKYAPDWRVLAKQVKDAASWTCPSCGAVLEFGPHRKLLHVHHINRITTDNRPKNLVSLCVVCHAGQDGHDGISYSKEDMRVIEKCRPNTV